jgi:hypothetical protein
MKINISIPNLNQAIQNVAKDSALKKKRVRDLVLKTGIKIQTTARVNQTPHVDTGRLRASIDMTPSFEGNQTEVLIFSRVKYAGYHEAKFPFLEPAALEHRQQFVASIRKIMGQ